MSFDKNQYTIDYIKKNTRQFSFKLSKIYDQEIIKHIESQGSINSYLKQLVLDDMARKQEEHHEN